MNDAQPDHRQGAASIRADFDALVEEMWRDADRECLQPFESYGCRCVPERILDLENIYREIDSPDDPAPAADGSATMILPDRPEKVRGAPPAAVGRYEIIDELRVISGQGRLYLGHDPTIDRRVVLKTLKTSKTGLDLGSDALERLRDEARIGGQLSHPNLCPVLDVVVDEGTNALFVVMPFVDGEPLSAIIDRARQGQEKQPEDSIWWISLHASEDAVPGGPLESAVEATAAPGELRSTRAPGELPILLRTVELIARAVHRLHEEGVVHRDIKPGNVLIRPDLTPVVLDFGLAFELEREDDLRRTTEGQILGTPAYMAPEQAEGRIKDVDRRSDIWALGVILYEMITLRRPFEHQDRRALLDLIVRADPARPRHFDKRIPLDLEAVCLKCLERDREHRYQSALDLARELECVRLLKPVKARKLTAAGLAWRWCRRHVGIIGVGALIASLAVLVVVFAMRPEKQKERDFGLARYLAAENQGDPAAESMRESARQSLQDPATLEVLVALARADLGQALRKAERMVRGDGERAVGPLVVAGGQVPSFHLQCFPEPQVSYRLSIRDREGTSLYTWAIQGADQDAHGLIVAEAPGPLPHVTRPAALRWRVESFIGRMSMNKASHGSFVVVPEAAQRGLRSILERPGGDPEDQVARALVHLLLANAEGALRELDAVDASGSSELSARIADLRRVAIGLDEGKAWARRVIEDCWMSEEIGR